MATQSSSGFTATVSGEHREGPCENCGTQTKPVHYKDTRGKDKVHCICPKCGGLGRLVARSVALGPYPPLKCFKPKCLYKFFKGIIYFVLLASYHRKRFMYAEKNRRKIIPMKYREGFPQPGNIKRALLAIIKLEVNKWLSLKL